MELCMMKLGLMCIGFAIAIHKVSSPETENRAVIALPGSVSAMTAVPIPVKSNRK